MKLSPSPAASVAANSWRACASIPFNSSSVRPGLWWNSHKCSAPHPAANAAHWLQAACPQPLCAGISSGVKCASRITALASAANAASSASTLGSPNSWLLSPSCCGRCRGLADALACCVVLQIEPVVPGALRDVVQGGHRSHLLHLFLLWCMTGVRMPMLPNPPWDRRMSGQQGRPVPK